MAALKKLKDTFKEIGTLGFANTETYNQDKVLKNKLEQAQGVSFAPKTVAPSQTYTPAQPEYYVPGDSFRSTGSTIVPIGNSTVSRAYLDNASPKLTTIDDDIRDLQKNNDTIKSLASQGQLTPEDTQEMLDQQQQGMDRAEILGKMVAKKRYQLGTRAFAQEVKVFDINTQKPESLINNKNLSSLYSPSEIDSYLATKPELPPSAIDFYTQKKAGGMTGDQIKQDIALNFIQKDIEDEMYDNKSFMDKVFSNLNQSTQSTGIEFIASIPHIAAFVANIPAMVSEADLTAQTGVGESLNKWTDMKTKESYKSKGIDTGEITGDANNNILAGQIVSTLIGLVTGSSYTKAITKLPVIAKFPKLAGAINMIVDGGKALEKGAPLSAKTVNVLQRLGASAIRNGLFTVGASAMLEGKGPTTGQLAAGTTLGMAGEGAFIVGGKALEAAGAKIGLSGLFSTKASMGKVKNVLSDAYADEGLKAADIDETFINNWLKAHTKGGEKADMLRDIKQFSTGKSADLVTGVMDDMSNGAAIIKDKKGDISGAIEKLIAKTSKGKSADDKLLTKRLEGMLKRIDAEGGIGATEANEVKRLIAERLHPFKQRGIGEPQNLDDAALYNTIKKELEDVADELGIDIRAVNKEVIEANVISSILEKEMLKDSMANMTFGDFTKWGAKQAFIKGIQSQFGPFDEDTVAGRISNIAFWQTASVLTKIPGFAIDKTVGLQTFKNWLSRLMTKFSPAEKGALEKFWQDGKAGKFNRTWREFAESSHAAASASEKMADAVALYAKENNLPLSDGLTGTMIGPKTGKSTTPVDVTLPGGEPSVPAGTPFPAIYDNTISARTSINGSNPNLAASLQESQLPGSQVSQNGMQSPTVTGQVQGVTGDIAQGQQSTGGYVDFSKGTTGANVTEVTPLVNPTPGSSLASTYERGFTLKNGKIDKEFGVKEMLADYKKLSPEDQAIAKEIYALKNIIEANDIITEANEIEIVSHPLTEEEALDLYKPIIEKIKNGVYKPKELIFINKNAPKSVQNELKNAGNELLGRKPLEKEIKATNKPVDKKAKESLPGLPKVEVPADYVPKDGLPTGTEFESTVLPTKTKTNKIPSPDIKRPQIRGIDLGIRSNMIDSLKKEGIFTDSFFAISDKNLSNKFIEYAEQKAIKKGVPTTGKEVSMTRLLDTAKNSADTTLTPKEYVKGLDGDKGIYLRFDIGDGNKVAVNSSYTDIFFKNFDDVTFKGSNEVSPVVVYSKGKDVGIIMPIKDPYGSKEVLGDFTTAETPKVEGKTAETPLEAPKETPAIETKVEEITNQVEPTNADIKPVKTDLKLAPKQEDYIFKQNDIPEGNVTFYTKAKGDKTYKITGLNGVQTELKINAPLIAPDKFEAFRRAIHDTAKANPDTAFQVRDFKGKVYYDSTKELSSPLETPKPTVTEGRTLEQGTFGGVKGVQPKNQAKFNQGENFEPVRVVMNDKDARIVRYGAIRSRGIKNGFTTADNAEMKSILDELGITREEAINRSEEIKKLAREARSSKEEVILDLTKPKSSMQSKTPQVEGKTATGVLKDWKPTKGGYSMDNIDIKNTNAFPRSQYHRPEYINSDSYKYWLEQAKQGKEIPPIVVEKKGDGYHILDGYHRIAAAEDAGVKNIKALVLDTPIDKTGKPFTKFTDEELKNISKPKPSLPMSPQKSEVIYSKPVEDTLIKEAKKYKSAEEFVKAQLQPDDIVMYNGNIVILKNFEGGIGGNKKWSGVDSKGNKILHIEVKDLEPYRFSDRYGQIDVNDELKKLSKNTTEIKKKYENELAILDSYNSYKNKGVNDEVIDSILSKRDIKWKEKLSVGEMAKKEIESKLNNVPEFKNRKSIKQLLDIYNKAHNKK